MPHGMMLSAFKSNTKHIKNSFFIVACGLSQGNIDESSRRHTKQLVEFLSLSLSLLNQTRLFARPIGIPWALLQLIFDSSSSSILFGVRFILKLESRRVKNPSRGAPETMNRTLRDENKRRIVKLKRDDGEEGKCFHLLDGF